MRSGAANAISVTAAIKPFIAVPSSRAGRCNNASRRAMQKRARMRGPLQGRSPAPVAVMPAMVPPAIVPMPAIVAAPAVMPPPPVVPAPAIMPAPAMVTMPAHLAGEFCIVVLHRRGYARIAQRQRLRTLGRRRQHEQPADGEQAQNLFHVHLFLLWSLTSKRRGRLKPLASRATRMQN